jgi:hypothetical protein
LASGAPGRYSTAAVIIRSVVVAAFAADLQPTRILSAKAQRRPPRLYLQGVYRRRVSPIKIR